MIHLTKGEVSRIVLTLNEKLDFPGYDYLCVFKNRSSNWEKKFVLFNTDDLSLNKERFNMFDITTDTFFKNALVGQYIYRIYATIGNSNLDTDGLILLETGIMELKDNKTIYTQYSRDNKLKIRQ